MALARIRGYGVSRTGAGGVLMGILGAVMLISGIVWSLVWPR